MANPMINSGTELLQFTGDDEYDIYDIVTKKIGTRQSKCVGLGVFAVIMFVLLCIGVYISFGMWDPVRSQRWNQSACQATAADCPPSFNRPPVILVSMDGFRASYLHRQRTPTLHRLAECGVSVPYMRASYPTKTFVNHYSIVTIMIACSLCKGFWRTTAARWFIPSRYLMVHSFDDRFNGLFPESHGIVDNWMFDPDTEKLFTLGSKDSLNPEWWQGEPIWNTVTKNGKVAATYFFPGSDVEIEGERPKFWYPYNKSTPFEHRVQAVLRWLDLPAGERPDFMTLYFDEPDTHGHMTGPDSAAVNNQLTRVDNMIQMLMDGLKRRRLHNCVNIVLLADHGMSSTSCQRVVRLDNYVNASNMLVFDGAFGRINTKFRLNDNMQISRVHNPESDAAVMEKLTCKSPHLTPVMKQNLPKRFHYANNKRIDNIVLNVEDSWLVARSAPTHCQHGKHGYRSLSPSMEAVFMAYGPSFKSGYKAPPFLNIELYNLLSELVGVQPAPNNGTHGALHHMLRAPPIGPIREEGHEYTTCTYPNDDSIYHQRANKTDCKCNVPGGTTIEDSDQRLNVTSEQANVIQRRIVPFGLPVARIPDNACVLTQRNYVSAYSHVYQTALWTSYVMETAPPLKHSGPCLRPDVRLATSTPNCGTYNHLTGNLQYEHLYPAWMEGNAVDRMDVLLLSNVVPMYEGFKNGIWHHLLDTARTWQAESDSKLHITVGPAYDYNYDGIKDHKDQVGKFVADTTLPVASHFYTVITRCTEFGLTCCNQYDNLAFILPHLETLPTCTNMTQYLLDHTARVRDVELITGLEFYSNMPVNVTLALVTKIVDSLW